MRLIHAADLHVLVNRYGDRTQDYRDMLARLSADMREHEADLLILAGDTFDSRRPGPDALRLVAEFLSSIRASTIILPGNHDGMTTVGDHDSHALLWLQALRLPGVHVLTQPGLHRIATEGGPVNVWALPYPHKRGLDADLADVPVDERARIVGERVEEAIRATSERPDTAGPFVFVGHVSIAGARLGSEAMMKMGWDAAITADALAPFDYAALGHIHRQQQVGPNAAYAGSPLYLDFGDTAGEKGWWLVDVEPGKATATSLPSRARQMLDIEAISTEQGIGLVPKRFEPGAIVRLVITGDTKPQAANLAAAQRWLRDEYGASYVKTVVRIERPVTETAKEAIDPEANTLDALAAWLDANGHPAEPTMSVGRTLVAAVDAA